MTEVTRKLLYRHRWGQAKVCLDDNNGEQRVIKNYTHCGFPGTLVYGLWVSGREFRALSLLSSINGFPQVPERDGRFIVSYQFIEGLSLKEGGNRRALPARFFPHLWRIVSRMHRSGFVHLDLGNRGNVLIRENGEPAIIDLASCTNTRYLPSFLVRWLRLKDKLGILKLWNHYSPETLPASLESVYHRCYKKSLHTPSRLMRATRTCLQKDQQYKPMCGRVRRTWIIIGMLGSFLMILGLSTR